MQKILFIGLFVIMASCKKEPLTTYNAEDSIYFNYRISSTSYYDSLDFSFAYSPESVTDTLIAVPLAVTGTSADRDRPVNLIVDPASTAEEGKHYELPQPVFHAGKIADTLFIRLKRAEDLATARKTLLLRLQPNESFKTDLKFRIALTTARDTLDLLSFKIHISNIFSQGPYWAVYAEYFGSFSEKKVRLINELVGMPLDFWLNEFLTDYAESMAIYYAATTARYLTEQAAAGNIIYDEDGSPMKMGPAYQ